MTFYIVELESGRKFIVLAESEDEAANYVAKKLNLFGQSCNVTTVVTDGPAMIEIPRTVIFITGA